MPRNVSRCEFTESEKDDIVRLYDEMGLNTLALRYECGQNKIKSVLRERRIPIRNRYYRRGNGDDSDAVQNRGTTTRWRKIAYESYMEQGLVATAMLYK